MGKFTTIKELNNSELWDWYDLDTRSILANKSSIFKYECAINRSSIEQNFEGTNTMKIDIRQFIEQNIIDTVIMDYMSLSYYYIPPSSPAYNSQGYQITHGYYRFFFESESSQVLFALKFSEHLTTKYRWQDDRLPNYATENMIWAPDQDGKWR